MGWSLEIKNLGFRISRKRKIVIYEIQSSLNGSSIEWSVFRMKKNPDLLQVSEVANVDEDLTADASKINKDNDNMNI